MLLLIGVIFICMRTIYIYTLKDPESNNIRYVGKTTNPKNRLNAHITRSKNNKYHSARWVKSLLNKGLKPILEVIEECADDNWQEREKFWIKFYNEKCDLTNTLEGGEGGATFGRLGKPWTKEQHAANKLARTGLSINQKDLNGNRQKAIRQFCDKNKKPILQYDLDGRFIKEWPSAVDAGKVLEISYSDINRSCKKETLTSAGFQWRYKNGEIKPKIEMYVKVSGSNKAVVQLTKDEKKIREYKSLSEVEQILGISRSNISNCLTGRSLTAGGFKWKYKE